MMARMQFANMIIIIKFLKAAKICSKPSRHGKVVGPMLELFIDTMNIKENMCA